MLHQLGIKSINLGAHDGCQFIQTPINATVTSFNPATAEELAAVQLVDRDCFESVACGAARAFAVWRQWPAPRRGEVIRQLGEELRQEKENLGRLVSIEMGKVLSEGLGEVQEMIDICDFAVGLSRQLCGQTMHSERPGHRMYEQWHPLGIVGVITAFNFPVAVWAWNAMIAAVCGDVVIWKPSLKTPLTALAVQEIVSRVMRRFQLEGVFNLVVGADEDVGEALTSDPRIPLISATGSCAMGRKVAAKVAGRLGRTLLELGGNNAVIVLDDADFDLALRAILFGAVGTAGQRCTSTRRVYMQKGIAPRLTQSLINAYSAVRIGDPLAESTLMGPLIDERAVSDMMAALRAAEEQGGTLLYGGKRVDRPGCFVQPALVGATMDMDIVRRETFAPILYLFEIENVEEAIAHNNAVDQGLSSAIFTLNLRFAEKFLSVAGSDCGIANVNIGTSGAEIGGAFGGEKDTGGGRESGSDAWKAYMRRQTNTINWSTDLPLAQGVTFDV